MKIIQNTAKIENGEIIIKVPEDLTSQEVNVIIIAEEDSQNSTNVIRNHKGFLSGYAPEDEGLYDDYPIG